MDLEQIRREYLLDGLRREHLNDNPRLQFEMWLQQAVDSGLHDPTAMVVATVDEYGCPNQRIVLLKQLDDRGFVFFTNYGSAKARELDANPAVSIHFPWHSMERQVRVRGVAKKIPVAESIKYFNSRPHDSQLAAWASKQSSRINSRTFLLNQFASMKEKFSKGQVPLPDFWGGYRIVPNYYEFWQGGQSRLHDRFEYRLLDDQKWEINRLAP